MHNPNHGLRAYPDRGKCPVCGGHNGEPYAFPQLGYMACKKPGCTGSWIVNTKMRSMVSRHWRRT